MKKLTSIAVVTALMGSFAVAGGDIAPVEPVVETPVTTAQPAHFYVGLGLAETSVRNTDASLNFFSEEDGQDRTLDMTFLAGYEVNPYFAIEGRYATNIAYDDEANVDTWSLFVKPQYPVSDSSSIYALIGYGGADVDLVRHGSLSDSDFQWGLGVNYEMMENVSVFVDYTDLGRINDTLDLDVDALTIGMTYAF